jgi:hypothetical protein
VHAVAVLATGQAAAWIGELVGGVPNDYVNPSNIGPSRFLGLAWLVVGVPLAAWLTVKGRIGLASLVISPYVLPYYLMMGLLDLMPRRGNRALESGVAQPSLRA